MKDKEENSQTPENIKSVFVEVAAAEEMSQLGIQVEQIKDAALRRVAAAVESVMQKITQKTAEQAESI